MTTTVLHGREQRLQSPAHTSFGLGRSTSVRTSIGRRRSTLRAHRRPGAAAPPWRADRAGRAPRRSRSSRGFHCTGLQGSKARSTGFARRLPGMGGSPGCSVARMRVGGHGLYGRVHCGPRVVEGCERHWNRHDPYDHGPDQRRDLQLPGAGDERGGRQRVVGHRHGNPHDFRADDARADTGPAGRGAVYAVRGSARLRDAEAPLTRKRRRVVLSVHRGVTQPCFRP